jgi:biofilm PGA synthesis N-glycosyltransferase PgaC
MREFATNIGVICGALLFLTWVGYPLVMELAARLLPSVPAAPTGPSAFPMVSIVVATRGPADLVQRRIENLRETAYPADRLEIVVGLDSAAASALDGLTVGSFESLSVARSSEAPGKAGALNAAVALSRGELIVFADSAQCFEPAAVSELIACFSDPRLGAVSGQLVLSDVASRRLVGWYWRMERRLRANEARVHSSVGVTGAIYAMRRQLFVPLPPDLLLDDLYTPMQLVLRGFRIGFTDRARALDAREFSVEGESRRKERTLAGVLQLCSYLPATLSPLRNPIWTQFVVHKLLRLASPIFLLAALPALWSMGVGIDARLPREIAPAVWLAAASLVVLSLFLPRGRSLAREFIGMNWAVLRAIHRGIRRDWNFW